MFHIRNSSIRKISQRGWLKLLAVVAISAIFIASCGSDDDDETEDTTTTVTPSSIVAPTTAPPPTVAPTTAPPPTTTAPPPTTAMPTTTVAPAPVAPNYDIAAGQNHTCRLNDGKVLCWGRNLHGQLGNGESGATAHSSVPVEVEGITDAVAVGAGWEHTCIVHATGEVSCWGDDSSGELGNGMTVNSVPSPVKVTGLDDAIDVTAGHWHTCALRSTGAISCWGSNHDGQLGNDDMGVDSAVPVSVIGISDAVSVSANGEHTCAVHATGEVSCWGDNWQGELGGGSSADTESSVPVKVSGVSGAVEVASGFDHNCALLESGRVSCWGHTEFGQVGNGKAYIDVVLDDSFIAEPGEVDSLDGATAVTAGGYFSCALHENGEVSCWGSNVQGQLGNATAPLLAPSPVPVAGIDDAIGVTAGGEHACVLRQGGAVSCFGLNVFGELGDGQSDLFTSEQVKVVGIDDAVSISSAGVHACALHSNGEISCWGRNWKGSSGDVATGDAPPVPIKIDGIDDATVMTAGSLISCAVSENDEMRCWGSLVDSDFTENEAGQISPVPTLPEWMSTLDFEDIKKIQVGGGHFCILYQNKTVTCIGVNIFGQLGNGEFGEVVSFAISNVPDIDDATDISTGLHHSCALHESGEVSCWGRNHFGQLGTGEALVGAHSAVPQRVLGITDAIAIDTGTLHTTCALHENGEVSCWGQNDFGELSANADASTDHSAVPVKIEGISDATAITASTFHVCALHENGEVSCWGGGFFGQLGTDEEIIDGFSTTPVKTAGISDATAISAGNSYTCALHETGEITCWGTNVFGQLGNGEALDTSNSRTPVEVIFSTTAGPAPVAPNYDIAAGNNHTCTLNDGKVWCWGRNLHGQLGNGESGATAHSSTPVEVEGITDAVAVGAGWEHTCVVHATGEVSCWGDDSSGELGNGVTVNSIPSPVKVIGVDDAIDVTAGHWHTCALHESGEVSCWGSNHDGQLGNDDMGVDSAVPVSVIGISDAVSVSASGEHTCAVHATGEVSCWGDNWRGELGSGESDGESEVGMESSVPVKVSGVSGAVEVASGFDHNCALLESGKVSCWGHNDIGQVGNGKAYIDVVLDDSFIAEPGEVDSLDDAISISSGNGFSCAVREAGGISCWGSNLLGQLGSGGAPVSPSPVSVAGIDDAIGVATGVEHTCAVREGGAVYCFGLNIHGELGDGQRDLYTSGQVKVAGIDDAASIFASRTHSCVLHSNGEISCWGRNWKGSTGDAATGDAPPVPIKIDGIDNATYLATGDLLSCAILESGRITCWGGIVTNDFIENEDGQISPIPTIPPIPQWLSPLDLESFKKLTVGGSHLCILDQDNIISCVGVNLFGQLGKGEFGDTLNFELASVSNIDDAIDISVGSQHSCALHESGEISCWGRNHFGQLGTGEAQVGSHSAVPQRVIGITDAIAVAASTTNITCALHENGEVSCWGQNDFGELGTNADPSTDHSALPVKIEGISNATAITAGNFHVCALHESGEVSCWGGGFFGQLGVDEEVIDGFSTTPVKVAGISDVTAISASSNHTCALHETSEVTCWGLDISGQLGSGTAVGNPNSTTPVEVIF